ncbi:amino acid permease, partial [Salmonella enterica]|uniref:amino acid permease n=1 Tax=Salmonella enterica TaxID=28901 RepID=UPI003CF2FEE9
AAVLVLGLVYAEMGSTYPYSGGEIVYVFAGLGTAPTFFIGWLLTLTYVAVCAFETVAAPWIVAVLFPEVRGSTLYRILGSEVHLGDVVL